MTTRTLLQRIVAVTLAATALSGCASTPPTAIAKGAHGPIALTDPRYSGLDNPTKPADLPRTASVLDVERYRPSFQLAACTPAPMSSTASSRAMTEAIAAAKAYSDRQSGLGLIVWHRGVELHSSFAEGVDGTTPSASASMMKSVVSLLYGMAIEDGVIGSVDDRVGDYLAEWNDDPRGDITLHQMLTMSAGLGQSDFMQVLLAPDISKAALALGQVGEPDSEFAYNNAITKVLADILDRQLTQAGKGDFLTYLQDELWCPLGNGKAEVWVDTTGKARGYAGLHAGLVDYARIGEMIRNGGSANGRQIVPSGWIAEMVKPSIANPQYGLHVWIARGYTPKRSYSASNPIKIPHAEPFAAEDILYFDGFGGQRVYIIPSKELVVARFGNVNLAYDDSVIPNLLTRALD